MTIRSEQDRVELDARKADVEEIVRLREAIQRLRNAGSLLRADIPCCNGCGCEAYDYCAADEWDEAILAAGVPR